MQHVDALRDSLPDAAKDLSLNLSSLLKTPPLGADRTWGVALTAAYFVRAPRLRDALLADAAELVSSEVVDDARAAASLMGMNTVLYRFRHLVGKESYGQRPAQLRMRRMKEPKTNQADFELFCLAAATLAGCQTCIQAHEQVVLSAGLSEQDVHNSVRIAAVIAGVAIACDTDAG
jgi:alkyl hydroperoxide reductase subunit D